MNSIKMTFLGLIGILLSHSNYGQNTISQSPNDNNNAVVGTNYTYTFNEMWGQNYNWKIDNFLFVQQGIGTFSKTWSETGTYTVQVFDNTDLIASREIVVISSEPPASLSWDENNEGELYFEGNVGIGNTNPDYKLDVTGNTRISGTILTTNHGTSANWNTAYNQRGSQIAGTGLTYTNGKLNIDEVNTDTQLTEAQVDAFVDNNGYYSSGSNPTFGTITTNWETFTNQEQPTNGANGTVYFDENYYDDFTAITGGNGGGLSILNQDGWGAILATNNMKWITPQFDGLGIGVASPSAGYRVEVNGAIKATGGNSTEWNTAFEWGDHRNENYLKAGESTNFTTLNTDKLGIGSAAPVAPEYDLHVRGTGPILGYFQQNASSGDDAGIKIRGSRSGSVSSDIAYVDLANFDSNEGSGSEFIMARIAGGTSVTSGRKGDLKFLTNSGASLTEKMRISHNGNVGIGTNDPSAALHITGTNYKGSPDIAGTQIRQGIIELTMDGSAPWIDFQNDINSTNYDARISLVADDMLAIQGANLSMEDMEIWNVKGIQMKDWDDNSGGTNYKYRLLARDGAFQFFNGGMVVGSYSNGTWADLGDGQLRVETNLGIGKISVDSGYKLDVNGAIQATGGNSNDWNSAVEWGDHSTAGYLLTESDDQVIDNLSLSGTTLRLSLENDGQALKTLDLSPFMDNTDTQLTEEHVDAFVANNGYLTTQSDDQNISISDDILTLENGGIVDLTPYLDNTDTQLTEAQVDDFVANNGYLTTQSDDQSLSLTSDILTLENGGTVDLTPYLDNTDTQLTEAQVDAFVANNGYYISGSNPTFGTITVNQTRFTNEEQATAGTTDGAIYFDQNYSSDYTAFTGGNGGGLSILNEDGWGAILATNNMKWVTAQFNGLGIGVSAPSDGYRLEVNGAIKATDGNSTEWNNAYAERGSQIAGTGLTWSGDKLNATNTNTDDQVIDNLSLSGNMLQISLENDGQPLKKVDLSAFMDNTDTQLTEVQVDAFVANNGYLTTQSDDQALTLASNTLTLEDGGSVDLSAYLDNTDTQLTEAQVDDFVANNGYLTTQSDDQIASEVDFDVVSSSLTSSNVQDVIEEVNAKIENKQGSRWTETNGNISYSNKVSIGTTNIASGYLLAVGGNAVMEEVNILFEGEWPDFVFGANYNMMSLVETAEYIKENQHLPNVPSAEVIKEEGIKVGEMNAILLQKIEELTLHLIKQNEQIESLQKRLEKVESK